MEELKKIEDYFVKPLVEPQEVADEQRFDEEELPIIKSYILGAQAMLIGAKAFDANSPITSIVIKLIVGYWLENRDGTSETAHKIDFLPAYILGLINQLKYREVKEDEESQSERHATQGESVRTSERAG